ncbi:MAG: hypothetical protein ACXACE_15095, partial [Candidatus Thorarchaeota archaeon]
GKYFLHGFFYSTMMTFSSIVLGFVVAFLIIIGSLIGLAVGFCVIFITMGLVNKELASYFWEIETSGYWLSLLGHGFILFLALLVVSIPGMIFQFGLIYWELGTIVLYGILFLLVFSLMDGYIGKQVAVFCEDSGYDARSKKRSRAQTTSSRQMRHSKCPICGSLFPYRMSEVSYDGKAKCRHCGALLQLPSP